MKPSTRPTEQAIAWHLVSREARLRTGYATGRSEPASTEMVRVISVSRETLAVVATARMQAICSI